MIKMCAQTKARSKTFVTEPSPNRLESASETGDQPAGHSFKSSAIREACQSSSVVTIPAISARIRSASPRWLPSKRAGRWTLRMIAAPITPASTSTANSSAMNANHPWWPSHGSVDSLSTAPIIAMIGAVDRESTLPWLGHQGWFAFMAELFAVLVLAGVIGAAIIRKVQRPARFEGSHLGEADLILALIAGIVTTLLLWHSSRIALGLNEWPEGSSPVSNALSGLFGDGGEGSDPLRGGGLTPPL